LAGDGSRAGTGRTGLSPRRDRHEGVSLRVSQSGLIRPTAGILCILLLQGLIGIAQAAPAGSVTPAPSNPGKMPKPVKAQVIGVLGDSLGDGLWAGLYRLLRRDRNFTVIKKSKVSSGLTQTTFFNWINAAETITTDDEFQIAVVFLGANDQQPLKQDKTWHRFRSAEWTRIYTDRITKLIKALKKKKLEVYWVGLPVMQKDGFDRRAQFLNGLYKKTAAELKVPYIDIRDVTAGEDGKYATHYKDINGKMRLMRADDGVHFTMSGYIVIASRVIAQIRAEREKAKRRKKTLVGAAMADRPRADSGDVRPGQHVRSR